MDAFSTESNLPYSDAPPVLIVGSSERAVARAKSTVGAFGVRIGNAAAALMAREVGHGGLTDLRVVDSMHERKALMVELSDAFAAMPGGFGTFEEFCEVVTWAQLGFHGKPCGCLNVLGYFDPLAAMLGDDVDLLIASDEAERASALALALARRGMEERCSDVASDRNAERLRQLSDEVSRIAATLARLSTGPSAAPRPIEAAPATDLPPLSAETIRSVIRARRLRTRYFPE